MNERETGMVGPRRRARRAPWSILGPLAAVVVLAPRLAVATVVCRCAEDTCGFWVSGLRDCDLVPANHRLRLVVSCSAEIPEDALPRVVTASGQAVPGRFVDIHYASEPATYEFSGLFPEGEELLVVGMVPRTCRNAFVGTFSCETASCAAPEAGARDCCAVYADAGLVFDATSAEQGGFGGTTAEAGSSGFGGGAGLSDDEFVYARFFTTAPDLTPPAVPELAVECVAGGTNAQAFALVSGELADAARVTYEFTRDGGAPDETVDVGTACDATGIRSFSRRATSEFPASGTITVRATATDRSGNESVSPSVTLSIPGDCVAEYTLEPWSTHACEGPPFLAVAGCEAPPDSHVEPGVPLCSVEESPAFGLGGLGSVAPATGGGAPAIPPSSDDGCSCSSAPGGHRGFRAGAFTLLVLLASLTTARAVGRARYRPWAGTRSE